MQQMVAQKRGIFAAGSWTITKEGISSSEESDQYRSSGIMFWSGHKQTRVTDSFIILYYDDPDNSYTVFFKDWFESEADWQRFLDLAKRSIVPREMKS